jgi:hypothetical protein
MAALLEQGDPRALTEYAWFVAMAERTRLPRFRYLAVSRQGTMAMLTESARTPIPRAAASAAIPPSSLSRGRRRRT